MALTSCPECAHRVSDQAPMCPGCGYPVKPASRSGAFDLSRAAGIAGAAWLIPNVVKWIAAAVMVVAMFYFVFGAGH